MQVIEALHEQIADLSTLLAELSDERRHQQENIPDQEECGGTGGLSLQRLPLLTPSLPLAQKGVDGGQNNVTAPPYSGSLISVRKSVSSAFSRNSVGLPGP